MPYPGTYSLPVSHRQGISSNGEATRKEEHSATTGSERLDEANDDHLNYGTIEFEGADRSWTSLPTPLAQQYRAAGLHPSQAIPKAPFPHRPAGFGRRRISDQALQDSLQDQKPPIHGDRGQVLPGQPRQQNDGSQSLRQQHLANLVFILHQSISKGDWLRAGRAWSLLLRSGGENVKLDPTPMDIRKDGRWAIGGEILLQGCPTAHIRVDTASSDRQPAPHSPPQSKRESLESGDRDIFALQNVRVARDYYDRLAVQYPYLVVRAEKPTDFYLAMYGCWLYEVSEKSRRDRAQISAEGSGDEDSSLGSALGGDTTGPNLTKRASAVRRVELQEARSIATRLDELLLKPPFDKSPDLLHLRGMISLWLADLFLLSNQQPDDEVEPLMIHHQRQLEDDRNQEKRKARDFFARCKINGGRVWEGVLTTPNSDSRVPSEGSDRLQVSANTDSREGSMSLDSDDERSESE